MEKSVSWDSLPDVISTKEAAAVARVSPALIRRLAKDNIIPNVRLGKNIRIPRDIFRKWIETNGQTSSTSEI